MWSVGAARIDSWPTLHRLTITVSPPCHCFSAFLPCSHVVHGVFAVHRETVLRLQSENKMLCVQEETYRLTLTEAQAELEDAQRSKNTLETQDR